VSGSLAIEDPDQKDPAHILCGFDSAKVLSSLKTVFDSFRSSDRPTKRIGRGALTALRCSFNNHPEVDLSRFSGYLADQIGRELEPFSPDENPEENIEENVHVRYSQILHALYLLEPIKSNNYFVMKELLTVVDGFKKLNPDKYEQDSIQSSSLIVLDEVKEPFGDLDRYTSRRSLKEAAYGLIRAGLKADQHSGHGFAGYALLLAQNIGEEGRDHLYSDVINYVTSLAEGDSVSPSLVGSVLLKMKADPAFIFAAILNDRENKYSLRIKRTVLAIGDRMELNNVHEWRDALAEVLKRPLQDELSYNAPNAEDYLRNVMPDDSEGGKRSFNLDWLATDEILFHAFLTGLAATPVDVLRYNANYQMITVLERASAFKAESIQYLEGLKTQLRVGTEIMAHVERMLVNLKK
jgi:hypothetical protein